MQCAQTGGEGLPAGASGTDNMEQGAAHRARDAERGGLQQAPKEECGRAVGARRQREQIRALSIPACRPPHTGLLVMLATKRLQGRQAPRTRKQQCLKRWEAIRASYKKKVPARPS